MEEPKPKVPPRTSLLKKGFTENGTDKPVVSSTKPILQPKPKISIPAKPTNSSTIFTTNSTTTTNATANNNNNAKVDGPKIVENNNSTTSSEPRSVPFSKDNKVSSVKVCNKLKISASDLNKLRFRTDLFETKNLDSKGNFLIYDVREDEEQIAKMSEIAELLVAGGYFRARIKGLHNFDKIIGGICWAIQMCNVDLDVDIFYQDTLSIGQKIALTEKIVRVLQKMKCPFKLEPHQIQGLDCIHIFPVIQWLVKKSFETRQQTSDYIRAYANWQFNRCYDQKDAATNSVIFQDPELATQLLYPIKAQLRRRFMHPSREKLQGENLRTKTTLLEYGVLGTGASQRLITQGQDLSSTNISKSDEKQNKGGPLLNQKSRSESDTQTVENLLNSMTEADENESFVKVSSSFVGSILSGQSEEIKRLAEDYDKKNSASLTSVDVAYLKKDGKLKNEISIRKSELDKLRQNDVSDKLNAIKDKLQMIDGKLRETEEIELNETSQMKTEKLELTEVLAALRKQKSELKQFCRDEKQRLEAQIELLDKKKVDNSELADKVKEIQADLTVYQERHDNVKKDLADVNKRYALIHRKFDDVPTRPELAQYQKRFLELYNQLSNKHNETKKFYTLYNILSEERSYLEKEFNLINSILDNFQKAHGSSAMVKDEFVVKFGQIVDSIIQNKTKVEQRLQIEKTKRDELNKEYIDLVELQRLYFMAVKQFKEECKNNEQLIAQLENRAT